MSAKLAKPQKLLAFAHIVCRIGQDLSEVKYHKYHKKPHNPTQPLGVWNIINVLHLQCYCCVLYCIEIHYAIMAPKCTVEISLIGFFHKDAMLQWLTTLWCHVKQVISASPADKQSGSKLTPLINKLRPRQNGCHFPDVILKSIFVDESFVLWFKFHWRLFLWVQLTIFQHWFIQWLGAVQATSHYLNQWWLVYQCIHASLCLNEVTTAMSRAQWYSRIH